MQYSLSFVMSKYLAIQLGVAGMEKEYFQDMLT